MGERPVIDFRGRKSSKANDLKLPSLTTEENWVEPIETIFKPKSTRVTFLPPRENMFSPKGEDHPKFNAVVEQLITGEKAPVQNPKNQHHIQLTSNSNKKTRLNETSEKTLNSPSIFNQ